MKKKFIRKSSYWVSDCNTVREVFDLITWSRSSILLTILKNWFLNVCISEQYSVTFLRYYVTSISLNIWLKQLPNSFTLLCLCSVFWRSYLNYLCNLWRQHAWKNISALRKYFARSDVHGIFARSYKLFSIVLKMTKHHFEDSKFNALIS